MLSLAVAVPSRVIENFLTLLIRGEYHHSGLFSRKHRGTPQGTKESTPLLAAFIRSTPYKMVREGQHHPYSSPSTWFGMLLRTNPPRGRNFPCPRACCLLPCPCSVTRRAIGHKEDIYIPFGVIVLSRPSRLTLRSFPFFS